ncbi:hypothetical protein jhhlp_001260 [Lomentospora prolificans]|uniref:Box C/D snoRNA protein 1 n=1 Tax=Lomentospora prolificans TaxID=41688 RepID=A0A2N3NHQ9_9PEZI|nr:hypothetical protein jhhlp_001260 [Lomentospora prolificans]
MADSLLTNLCAICHISAPKYKCPRCATRTCSLQCIKKHKSWSSCSGVRDATAYVPKRTLATPAGVDHDYNFISAIERSRERSENVLVDEKGIVSAKELRPVTVENVEYRFKDGKMRRVLVTRALRGEEGDWGDMRARLKRFGITAVRAPVGMSRRRENGTRYFKRSRRVEWYVEVFLVTGREKERVTMRIVDDLKVSEAFLKNKKTRSFGVEGNAMGGEAKALPFTFQDDKTGAWMAGTTICTQNLRSAVWFDKPHPDRSNSAAPDAVDSLKKRLSFYLSRPPTTSSAPTTLVPFDPEEKLHDVLAGTVVLEYPTLYVLEKGAEIPKGLVVGTKPKAKKRKSWDERGEGGKKRKLIQELEDGEVMSDAGPADKKVGEKEDESDSSSDSSSSSSSDDDDVEAEEVLAEVSLSEGEEEEDGDEDAVLESEGE